jgi:bifunctional DNA-binding transcriptional regulator/antitoxin component of YhaV-PrlF toxin-antitoxin module
MSATTVREKRQTTLPLEVCEAAGLKPNDQVDWRFEDGEIRGRKLVASKTHPRFPRGSLLKYFTPEKEREEAAIFEATAQGPG